MITEHKLDYYVGSIVGVVGNDENPNPNEEPFTDLLKDHKSQEHIAVVTVPGLFEKIIAYPGRNQLDEPKIGDLVVIAVWDPHYNSYSTYEKLKENDFVGFRSQGKMINITHDQITVGVYDETVEYKDEEIPDTSKLAHLIIDKEGNIDIHAAKDITIKVEGNTNLEIYGDSDSIIYGSSTVNIMTDSTINIQENSSTTIMGDSELLVNGDISVVTQGNASIDVSGDAEIAASGSCTIDSPDVKITGASLTVGGTSSPSGSGPFNCLPACIFSGCTHVGNKSLSN